MNPSRLTLTAAGRLALARAAVGSASRRLDAEHVDLRWAELCGYPFAMACSRYRCRDLHLELIAALAKEEACEEEAILALTPNGES